MIPDLDLPETLAMRQEWLTRVGNLDGLPRLGLAAIPEVSTILVEVLLAGGNEDLVGALLPAALLALSDPAQAWTGDINTEWIVVVLAAQVV